MHDLPKKCVAISRVKVLQEGLAKKTKKEKTNKKHQWPQYTTILKMNCVRAVVITAQSQTLRLMYNT